MNTARRLTTRLVTLVALGAAALLTLAVTTTAARAVSGPGAPLDDVETQYGRMILVLDSSGSMAEKVGGTSKIAAAKQALTQVVGDLPPEAFVGLRVYGAKVFSKSQKGACTDSQLVVPPSTDNRDALRSAIGRYKPYGETPIAYALKQAAKDIGSEGKRSIVLVSDGEATCAPDPCQVAGQLAAAGIDLQIDVVGLSVSGKARDQLRCIAKKGNGTYYDVDTADEIAGSLSRVAERAVRPFRLDGKPIKGSLDETTPTPITEGVWTDTLPPGSASRPDDLYYTFKRTIPGSTVHIAVNSTGERGHWDSIQGELSTPDGTVCDTAGDQRTIDGSSVLGLEAIAGHLNTQTDDCATADTLVFDLERGTAWSDVSAPVGLLVTEEPPVQDAESLPEPSSHSDAASHLPAPRTPEKPIVGGTSFPDATPVQPGSYSGTIVPGEAQVFRVHLGWGQQLSVQFRFPKATKAIYEHTGVQGPFATVRLYDPLRAAISDRVGDSKPTGFSTGAQADDIHAETYPVRYRNRSTTATYSALAGDYYVMVGVDDDPQGETYVLPYSFDVAVTGSVSGAPTSAGDPDWEALQGIAKNDTDSADEPEVDSADAKTGPQAQEGKASEDGGSIGKVLTVGGLAVLGLACVGGAAALLRRTRPTG